MMKSYGGLEMIGKFIIERVNSLPTWASDDEGRILYNNTDEKLWIGGSSDWVSLVPSIDTYEHDQTTASSTWNVNHNLGERICHVMVVNSNYEKVIPDDITFTDNNNLTIVFDSLTISGKAKISI